MVQFLACARAMVFSSSFAMFAAPSVRVSVALPLLSPRLAIRAASDSGAMP